MTLLMAGSLPCRLHDRIVGHGGSRHQVFQAHDIRWRQGAAGISGHLVELMVVERQVGAREGRLPAQSRGNQRVRIGFAQQHERPPKALDVRLVPRLSRHEILGDEPRFRRGARRDIGVGQLCLRAEHRRFESTVDAQLDQMHQRRDVIRHAGDELLQHRRGARPVALSDGGFGSELDDLKTGFRVALGHSPPQKRDLLPARRILFEQPPHDDQAVLDAFAAELDVGDSDQAVACNEEPD